MKLLLVADIHYALKQFDWLLAVAPSYDGVVLAGDLLEVSAFVEPGTQIVVVRKYLSRLAEMTQLAVCSGNHDLDARTPDGERRATWLGDLAEAGVAVDGSRARFGDSVVSVFPWWDGPASKAAVAAQMARDAEVRGDRWIWVYHAPPAGNPTSWTGTRHSGDPELPAWIEAHRPDLVLSGHVHQAPFTADGAWASRIGTTWVFNAGQQPGDVPSHVVLDPDAGQAMWVSIDGAEVLDLAGDAAPVSVIAPPDWAVRARQA